MSEKTGITWYAFKMSAAALDKKKTKNVCLINTTRQMSDILSFSLKKHVIYPTISSKAGLSYLKKGEKSEQQVNIWSNLVVQDRTFN